MPRTFFEDGETEHLLLARAPCGSPVWSSARLLFLVSHCNAGTAGCLRSVLPYLTGCAYI